MKKLLSLFLVFSLMMLSANLYAKERRGAKLIITKKDGQQIEGELITVKPNSLLLLDIEGKDVSVGVADIKAIRIVKKSKALLAGGIGLLIGGGIGALVGGTLPVEGANYYILPFVLIGALIGGALIGGIIYWFIKTDKTIHFEGMTDQEIQETLDYLRKYARIRDYK